MKKLLAIFIFNLCFITPSQADDIRDFEIEGISIGDSLLDFVDKDEISQFSDNLYKIDEYYSFTKVLANSMYDGYQVHYKKNDSKFKIVSLEGIKLYTDNISECESQRKKIVSEVKNMFTDPKLSSFKRKLVADPSGNSRVSATSIYLNKKSRYEDIQIACYDWGENYKFSNGSKAVDKLTVSISTSEYFKFLKRAYK